MEVIYSQLKQKEVINLVDGKHLGKVCDLTFTFPEGNIVGFTATGGKGFRFSRQEVFLPLKSVVKIGEDAVLVNYGKEKEKEPPAKRPPKGCPPPCPPPEPCPPNRCYADRRSLDEYE